MNRAGCSKRPGVCGDCESENRACFGCLADWARDGARLSKAERIPKLAANGRLFCLVIIVAKRGNGQPFSIELHCACGRFFGASLPASDGIRASGDSCACVGIDVWPCRLCVCGRFPRGNWLALAIGSVLRHGSNLVDPASSHMLILKIKPCMSKYK